MIPDSDHPSAEPVAEPAAQPAAASSAPLDVPAPVAFPRSPRSYTYPGAKWWKFDFHTHTPASLDYAGRAGPALDQLKRQTATEWLQKHMNRGLDAVVVTDHNTTDFIGKLRDAYNQMDTQAVDFRPLVIFPGFELSVHGGLHLLAIFDPQRDLSDVNGVITACGYKGRRGDTNDGVCSESFEKCITIIKEHGGLAVAAHIDEACGLLWNKLTTGEEVRNLMRADDCSHESAVNKLIQLGRLAPSIHEHTAKLDQTIKNVLAAGLDAIEVRNWDGLPSAFHDDRNFAGLARVTGSDSHMPRDIGRNGYSMVHMTEPNLEGLHVAFADGSQVRDRPNISIKESLSVRRILSTDVTDYNAWPACALEKLSLLELKTVGRNGQVDIPLHPRLNVFIGGRGSGKSTFVHALRLASQRGRDLPRFNGDQPLMESPAGDFWRWAKIPAIGEQDGVIIRGRSIINAFYRTRARSAELHWNANAAAPAWHSAAPEVKVGPCDSIPDADGGAYSPNRFPLSIYSQKQVLEMSRGSAGIMEIIDREQNVHLLEDQLTQLRSAYSVTKAKIRELATALANEARDQATLSDVTLELEKVQSEVVKNFQNRQAQARVLLSNATPIKAQRICAHQLGELAERIGLPEFPSGVFIDSDTAAKEAQEIYKDAKNQLSIVAQHLSTQATAITEILANLDQKLRESHWIQAYDSSKAAFEDLLGAQATLEDPKRLQRLNQRRSELELRLADNRGIHVQIAQLEVTSEEQLFAIKSKRNEISASRELFVKRHNEKVEAEANGAKLRMKIIRMGAELNIVERSLREAMGVEGEKFGQAIGLSEGDRENSLLRIFKQTANREIAADNARKRILDLIDADENEQGFADLQNNLRRQISHTPTRRDAIETWFPDDRLELEYWTPESQSWKSISQGSIGQQTAAVLSFLLSFGNEPLILDQPEDDLDTRMIMSLIVDHVRAMKDHRQIIIITHNPNIVVHGDADLVHAMEDVAGQISRNPAASGGLQNPATRKFICDVMEGGAIAFRRRYERMGGNEG